jgi:hypothetical protein
LDRPARLLARFENGDMLGAVLDAQFLARENPNEPALVELSKRLQDLPDTPQPNYGEPITTWDVFGSLLQDNKLSMPRARGYSEEEVKSALEAAKVVFEGVSLEGDAPATPVVTFATVTQAALALLRCRKSLPRLDDAVIRFSRRHPAGEGGSPEKTYFACTIAEEDTKTVKEAEDFLRFWKLQDEAEVFETRGPQHQRLVVIETKKELGGLASRIPTRFKRMKPPSPVLKLLDAKTQWLTVRAANVNGLNTDKLSQILRDVQTEGVHFMGLVETKVSDMLSIECLQKQAACHGFYLDIRGGGYPWVSGVCIKKL